MSLDSTIETLCDLLSGPAPLLPESLPTDMKPLIEYLQQLKTEVMFCVRGICMKTSIKLTLMNHASLHHRNLISESLGQFLAQNRDATNEDVHAFLVEQFQACGISLAPITNMISSDDFLKAFGYTNVFQSSVSIYLYQLTLAAHYSKHVPPITQSTLIDAVFPPNEMCIGREFLPRLMDAAIELEGLVYDQPVCVR